MLDKIFNRKYLKAKELLDEEIKNLEESEKFYRRALEEFEQDLSSKETLLTTIDDFHNRVEALQELRREFEDTIG